MHLMMIQLIDRFCRGRTDRVASVASANSAGKGGTKGATSGTCYILLHIVYIEALLL